MPSGSSTLVLVRHGHTAANAQGMAVQMSGWTDLPLSDQGRADAMRVAHFLASQPRACAAYSSPLERALATAHAIVERCPMRLATDPDLREIYCGSAEGLRLAEVESTLPEFWARNLSEEDADFRWPGGESYRELRARSDAAIRRIAARHPGDRVIVVTHAGVISQLMGLVHGVTPACWSRYRPRNGSITELCVSAETLEVTRFDELPGETLPRPSVLVA